MAEPTTIDPELIHAARNRWRAGLLRWHAAELEASVDGAVGTVAEDLTAQAAAKTAQADLHDEFADADEEYVAKRAGLVAGTLSRAEWEAFSVIFTTQRTYWRGVGVMAGTRGQPNLDNFTEPTDDELMEALA